MKIEYDPTLDMIGDYFTEPLQGRLFQKVCNLILVIDKAYVPKYNIKAHWWIREKKKRKYTLTNITKAGGWYHRSV